LCRRGGGTFQDASDLALRTLLPEWAASATYAAGRAHLMTGVRPGNAYKLTLAQMIADAPLDQRKGGAGTNWFWGSLGEVIPRLQSGEKLYNQP
jgi:hypothetical protein